MVFRIFVWISNCVKCLPLDRVVLWGHYVHIKYAPHIITTFHTFRTEIVQILEIDFEWISMVDVVIVAGACAAYVVAHGQLHKSTCPGHWQQQNNFENKFGGGMWPKGIKSIFQSLFVASTGGNVDLANWEKSFASPKNHRSIENRRSLPSSEKQRSLSLPMEIVISSNWWDDRWIDIILGNGCPNRSAEVWKGNHALIFGNRRFDDQPSSYKWDFISTLHNSDFIFRSTSNMDS